MKLFHYLNNNDLPFQNDPFLQLVLKRLSIMEALATIKFKRLPVEDAHRELIIITHLRNRCQKTGYSIQKSKMIELFFSENMRLAKCIQTACFHEWETLSDETVQNMGLISAREMISDQLSSHTLLQSLREYASDTTDAMFDTMALIKKTPELNALIEPLTICFPCINSHELKKIIAMMTKYMTELTSLFT